MNKGDFIKINYIGRLESGEVFDLTDEETAKKEKIYSKNMRYGPVTIVVGSGFVIPGLDKALLEMKVGEKRSIVVEPKDGFGERNPEMVKTVPEKTFKDQNVEIKQGMVLDFGGMKGRVQSISAGRVRIDFNNPLAGKVLKYDLEIVSKVDDTGEKIAGLFGFFGVPDAKVRISGKEAIIESAMPHEVKSKISGIILSNVKDIDRIVYQETYERKEESNKGQDSEAKE